LLNETQVRQKAVAIVTAFGKGWDMAGFVENLFLIDSILDRLDKLEVAMEEVTNAVNTQKKMLDLMVEYNEQTDVQVMLLNQRIDKAMIMILGGK